MWQAAGGGGEGRDSDPKLLAKSAPSAEAPHSAQRAVGPTPFPQMPFLPLPLLRKTGGESKGHHYAKVTPFLTSGAWPVILHNLKSHPVLGLPAGLRGALHRRPCPESGLVAQCRPRLPCELSSTFPHPLEAEQPRSRVGAPLLVST